MIQASQCIKIAIYAVNSVGMEKQRTETELSRIRRVYRSTMLIGKTLSMVSGMIPPKKALIVNDRFLTD